MFQQFVFFRTQEAWFGFSQTSDIDVQRQRLNCIMDFRRFSTLPVFAVVEKRAGRQRAQPVELLDILNCTFGLLLLQPAANELQSKQRKRGGSSNATVREKRV